MGELVLNSIKLDESMNDVKGKISKMENIITDLQTKKNNSNDNDNDNEKQILERYKIYVDYLKKISEMKKIITDLQTKINNSNDNEKQILERYKIYVEYLEKILTTKYNLDNNIINVQKNVFEKLNIVFDKIQEFATIKIKIDENSRKAKTQTEKKNLSDNEEDKLKTILIDIGEIEKNETLFNQLNCEPVVNVLEKVLNTYETDLGSLNVTTTGGANTLWSGVILNSNTKEGENIIKIHNEKLNKIKELYETHLQDSIKNFKLICEALKKLVNSCIEIIEKLTTALINNKRDLRTLELLNNNKSKKFIKYVGLNLENFDKINDLFDKNKKALDSMLKQITNEQEKLNNASIDKPIKLQQAQAAATNNTPAAAATTTTQGGRKRNTQKNKTKTKKKSGGAKKTKKQSGGAKKTKKQSGGFVRGGVLFPESFYKADIVM